MHSWDSGCLLPPLSFALHMTNTIRTEYTLDTEFCFDECGADTVLCLCYELTIGELRYIHRYTSICLALQFVNAYRNSIVNRNIAIEHTTKIGKEFIFKVFKRN